MKPITLASTVLASAIGGAFLGATLLAAAGVTIPTISDDRSHSKVQASSLHAEWDDNDDSVEVHGIVYGERANGSRVDDTRTDIEIALDGGSGAPQFTVRGFAVDAGGITPTCSGSRAAILAVTNDLRTKLENFADNCLN